MLKILFTAIVFVLPAGIAPAWAGDLEAGRKLYAQCRACHEIEAGKNKVGPSLHNMFGRKSGTLEGFKFSPAMTKAEIVWNEVTLSDYLADPTGYIKGTRMAYIGLKDPQQRADIIAFLREATK
jgi:cytochrome c